jgi:hypothetical protein
MGSVLHLLITVILVVNVGLAEASDNGDNNIETSNTVPQAGQSQLLQSEILQTPEPRKNQQNFGSKQRAPDRTVEKDDDRLRDLEEELYDEQLKYRDRDSARKQ